VARIQGYQVTLKLFIPVPKTDFKAQAAAASIMDAIMNDRVLTAELVAAAVVIDVSGKYSSTDAPNLDARGDYGERIDYVEPPTGRKRAPA
jgi:hypothetical protein